MCIRLLATLATTDFFSTMIDELENYTERQENSFVSNGNLIIEARQESYNGSNYTSARMVTKGKKTFTYGRIDIRAKLPKGKGIWPALWMLGNNIDQVNWPVCGEIDIMELRGQEPNIINGTIHGPGYSGGSSISTGGKATVIPVPTLPTSSKLGSTIST